MEGVERQVLLGIIMFVMFVAGAGVLTNQLGSFDRLAALIERQIRKRRVAALIERLFGIRIK